MHLDNKDTMRFTDINNPEDLWFSKQDNHLVIKELGSQDSVTINDWFTDAEYRIEDIRLADQRALDLSRLDRLISAMANFEQEHGGDITLASQEEVKAYMDKLAVSSYWG